MQLKLFKRFENIDEIIESIPERKRNSTAYLEKAIKYFLKMKTKYRRATKKEAVKYLETITKDEEFDPEDDEEFDPEEELEFLSEIGAGYYVKRTKPLSIEDLCKIKIIKKEKDIVKKINLVRKFNSARDFYLTFES